MSQILNSKELESCYYSDNDRLSTEINKIYYGTQMIWEGIKVIDLGTNTSWNIKTLYPNLYRNLTVDNFFFMSANSVSANEMITMAETETQRKWGGFTGGLYKAYSNSTGILNAYIYTKSNTNSVRMVLVTKPEKLIYLGNGTSFDVTSYSNYRNFTANNFLIKSATDLQIGMYFYPQGYMYRDSGTGTTSITKSYNSNTGIVSSTINLVSVDTSGVYQWFNASTSGNIVLYLYPKV